MNAVSYIELVNDLRSEFHLDGLTGLDTRSDLLLGSLAQLSEFDSDMFEADSNDDMHTRVFDLMEKIE